MTDREYEKMMVESALGIYLIKECDKKIADLEKAMSVVQGQRRMQLWSIIFRGNR